jgi:hypothetical protein
MTIGGYLDLYLSVARSLVEGRLPWMIHQRKMVRLFRRAMRM